ncbi:MAG: hypothetical protein EZS28_004880 [Streblomastix strix]|uniref:Uncharacterized protein n=1 Tax=Streblomastix strix TaxID=222440 RepID=A0A5J4WYJ8_9EUKA|nr:MAG: hypothetical protein EZS28_004880 [Streblomastix strix]
MSPLFDFEVLILLIRVDKAGATFLLEMLDNAIVLSEAIWRLLIFYCLRNGRKQRKAQWIAHVSLQFDD